MVKAEEYTALYARATPEKVLQEWVRRACVQVLGPIGGLYYHTHRSERSPAGFPDVVAVFPTGHLFVVELKRECVCTPRRRCSHHPTPLQRAWLDRLSANPLALVPDGPESGVWRPSDYLTGRVVAYLADVVRAVRPPARTGG